MASWYSKELGDGVEAYKPTMKIMEAFLSLAKAGHYSPDAAVFSRYDLVTNVVTIYFSPSAELLAQAFVAVPCEKPIPRGDLGLIVGDARAWEVHFPGYLSEWGLSREE